MSQNKFENDLKFEGEVLRKEYAEFLLAKEIEPPIQFRENIFKIIQKELNPSFSSVLVILGLIHTVAGAVTLLFCSQFGVGFSEFGKHFFHQLHQLSPVLCMGFCGSLFVGSGAALGSYLLRPEQIRIVRKHGFAYLAFISIFFLLVFLSLGQHSFNAVEVVSWIMAAILIGRVIFELGVSTRRITQF